MIFSGASSSFNFGAGSSGRGYEVPSVNGCSGFIFLSTNPFHCVDDAQGRKNGQSYLGGKR